MTTNERWRVLIADDEPAARRGVRQLLASYAGLRDRRRVPRRPRSARRARAMTPDVLFLDIQMPEINGFEVIRRRTPERMPAVVFLTAYDQFAIRAFEAEALDYLVKPVSEARFAATIKRLAKRLALGGVASATRASSSPRRAARSCCPCARSTGSKRRTTTRGSGWGSGAISFANRWRNSSGGSRTHGFVRAHRQALVRLDGVRALLTTDAGDTTAVLTNGARVPVSRRRRAAFAAAVKQRGV